MSEEKKFYQDYRFFMKAKDTFEAQEKLMDWLPCADDDVDFYTVIGPCSEFTTKDDNDG